MLIDKMFRNTVHRCSQSDSIARLSARAVVRRSVAADIGSRSRVPITVRLSLLFRSLLFLSANAEMAVLPDDVVMETAADEDAIGPAKPKLDRAVECKPLLIVFSNETFCVYMLVTSVA